MLKSPMMTGDDVRAVQQALNQRDHAGLDTDAVYGPPTRDAVMTWQQREHIEVDGIVGPQTRSTLGLPTSSAHSGLSRTPRMTAPKPGRRTVGGLDGYHRDGRPGTVCGPHWRPPKIIGVQELHITFGEAKWGAIGGRHRAI